MLGFLSDLWTILLFALSCIIDSIAGAFRPRKPKQDNNNLDDRITTCVKKGSALTPQELTETWDRFNEFFTKEMPSKEYFSEYLSEDNRDIILIKVTKGVSKRVVGFAILTKLTKTIDGKKLNIVKSDFFGLDRKFRQKSDPLIAILTYTVRRYLTTMMTPLYYFFITYSYKSYLSFGHAVGEYWPRHSVDTPPFEKRLLDMLGKDAQEDWGEYDPDTCIIKDKNKGTQGRLALTSSAPPIRALSKTIEFYFETNPHFRQGDCLCVICKVNYKTLWRGALKFINRTKLHAKRMRKIREYNQQHNADAPSDDADANRARLGGSSEMNIAFGKHPRRGDSHAAVDEFDVMFDAPFVRDLLTKLKLANLPEGKSSAFLRQMALEWTSLDFSGAAETLNQQFAQYTMDISNVSVHFAHSRAHGSFAMPLLLIHGWPSTFSEFGEVIHMLSNPDRGNNFHVVVPSLPCCPCSDRADDNHFDVFNVAQILSRLMLELGYTQYGIHGSGELGSTVASWMASSYPDCVYGIHITCPIPKAPSSPLEHASYFFKWIFRSWLCNNQDLMSLEKLARRKENGLETLERELEVWSHSKCAGLALNDSPLAQAAWFFEKYRRWTDCKGDLTSVVSTQYMLTLVTLFYKTGGISSSLKLMKASVNTQTLGGPGKKIEVPTAVQIFPHLPYFPRAFCSETYNIMRWNVMSAGGAFPALEAPKDLVMDIQEFFRKLNPGLGKDEH